VHNESDPFHINKGLLVKIEPES